MGDYREIISRAVISKGKKTFSQKDSINVDNSPSTILGCWVINHKFNGIKQGEKIVIEGSFDINIWYSYDNDTKTDVVKETHNYSEIVKMRDIESSYDNTTIVVRSLTEPKCVNVTIDNSVINYQVDLELGIELVGDIKLKVAVQDNLDDYELIREESKIDEEIDNNVDTNYLKEE